MIYSCSDNRATQTQIDNFSSYLPFIPPKTLKMKMQKNEKNCWRYHHFTHGHQKSQSHDVQFLRYRARQTKLFVIFGYFSPFYLFSNDLKYQNFWKKIILLYIQLSFYTYKMPPPFIGLSGKQMYSKDSFNHFVYKFYPKRILILEQHL